MIKALFDYILKAIKFFYAVPKAGNYWFAIYHKYYINNLTIIE